MEFLKSLSHSLTNEVEINYKDWNETQPDGTCRIWTDTYAVDVRDSLGLLIIFGRYHDSWEKNHDL